MEDIIGHLIGGFGEALQPVNLLMLVIGVMVGLFVGALPGLGSVNGVAILLQRATYEVPGVVVQEWSVSGETLSVEPARGVGSAVRTGAPST